MCVYVCVYVCVCVCVCVCACLCVCGRARDRNFYDSLKPPSSTCLAFPFFFIFFFFFPFFFHRCALSLRDYTKPRPEQGCGRSQTRTRRVPCCTHINHTGAPPPPPHPCPLFPSLTPSPPPSPFHMTHDIILRLCCQYYFRPLIVSPANNALCKAKNPPPFFLLSF